MDSRTVEMNHSCVQLERKPHGELQIIGEHSRRKTIGRVVGERQSVIGVVSSAHCRYRAEKFVAKRGHVGGHVSQHRRVEEIPIVVATCQQARTSSHGILDFSIDHRALGGTNERPDDRMWIARVSTLQRPSLGYEFLQASIGDRRLDYDSGPGHTNLALMDKYPKAGGVHS